MDLITRPDELAPATDTPHRRLMASAGSGKTYRLVLRAVELLHAGEPIEAIVASTFTRNAAGEIRDRILARLCAAADDPGQAASLERDLRRHRTVPWASPAPMDQTRARELLVAVAAEIHRLQVRTLDGFFASIVQAFPAELGVSPGATILDEADAQRLGELAIGDLLGDEDRGDATVRLLRTLTQGRADSGVDRLIASTIDAAWTTWRESEGPQSWMTMDVGEGPDDAAIERALADLAAAGTSGRYDTALWKTWLAAVAARIAAGDWTGLTRRGPAASLIAGKSKYGSREFGDDVIAPLRVIIDRARVELRRMHDERTRATAELCARYGVHHEMRKRDAGRLAFEDLARLLVDGMPEDLERVAWRLDGRLHHLLLDEFQDTGIGQWAVLRPMAERLVEDRSGQDRRSLFVVGDVKQSIYAWRSGRPEILENLRSLLLGPGEDFIADEPLRTSWRSSPVVLSAVNRIFGDLPVNPALKGAEEAAAAAAWDGRWRTHEAAVRDGKGPEPGYVELRTGPARPDIANAASRKSAQQADALGTAVARVRRWRTAMPDASIGVLVRRQASAARILESLRRGEPSVDAIGPGGRPLVDEPAVTAVLSMLWLADHPGDLAAAFHVAESPVGAIVGMDAAAIRDPARRRRTAIDAAARVRDRLAREGLAGMLGDVVRRLAPHCDASQLGRLRHLLEAAAEREADLGPRPSAFVRVATTLRAPERGRGTVSVMTFHAAKGLEFDLVVATDLGGALTRPPAFLADRRPSDGTVHRVTTWVARDDRWILDDEEQEAYVRAGTSAVRESLCMLYVAATRARHGLSLVVPAPALKKDGDETFPCSSLHGVLRGGLIGDLVPDPDDRVWSEGDEAAVVARLGGVAVPSPDGDAPATIPPAPSPSAASEVVPAPDERALRLRPGPPRRPRPISAAAASTTAEATVPLAERLRPSDREPRDRGTAIHALLESIQWLDEDGGPDPELAVRIVRRALPRATEEWARRQAAELPAILARPAIRALLELAGRDSNTVTADNERPWVRAGAGGVQQGFIDRVVIERGSDGTPIRATVVDWKTDQLDGTASAEEQRRHVQRYAPQLETYRAVVAVATGLPPDEVATLLAFVSTGLVLDVPAASPPASAASPDPGPEPVG